jgi:hypothetical protein
MNIPLIRSAVAGLALTGVMMTSIAAPARADGAATTRTIIGAAAAIAGIATAINVSNKHRQAATVTGYLPDGSTVYADGHVVAPNGYSWYPGNQGQQIACNGQNCQITGNGYGYNGGYNNGGYYNNGNYGYNNSYYGNNNGYYGYNGQPPRHHRDHDGDDNPHQ